MIGRLQGLKGVQPGIIPRLGRPAILACIILFGLYLCPAATGFPLGVGGALLTGTLSISSVPSGAYVYMDDWLDKGVTPVVIPNVIPGPHTLRLRMQYYKDYDTIVTVNSGETTSVEIHLESPSGSLSVTSTPTGANVYLNNVYKGTTPILIPNLAPGWYTLKLSKPGYQDTNKDVTIMPEETTIRGYVLPTLNVLPPTFSTATTVSTTTSLPRVVTTTPVVQTTVAVDGGGGGGHGDPTPGLFVLLLVFAAIALYLWTRNNLSLVVKQKSVPADGTSTVPIRIQFANGFGQLKKQKFDREITMDATSGTIKSVVLPEGKAFVDVPLTTSRECGNVRVAASYEGQKAHDTVEFRCDGGSLEITPAEVEIAADGKSKANLVIRMKDRSGNYLHFIDEKTVNLTTTLGTVSSPIRIPSRTQEIRATLVSGTVQGVAIVTATLDQMKGETTIRLKGRFCMHCGASMGTGAAKCPSCNKAPLSGGGVDTKTCPACGAVIPVGALFCEWCGAKQAK
jgi:ribosomal protein L40E